MNDTTSAFQERKSRRFWVLVIVGFFSLDIVIAIIAISMAAGDPSFRSIPGFGERAVAWDQRQALKEVWEKQGWTAQVSRAGSKMQEIELVLQTADGQPVVGCQGSMTMFHYTRVAVQLKSPLVEREPGRYRASIEATKPGMWNMEVDLLTPNQETCWYEQSFDWPDVQQSVNNQGAIE